MVQVKARILAPPRILYGRNMDARAAEGSWNLRGKTVRIQLATSQVRTRS
jgi:eukaryotic translation initiation factor 2C